MKVQADLVDQVRLEKRVRQLTAAHHADAFALSPFQLPDECGRIRRYDFDLLVGSFAQRARKHVVLHAWIGTRAALQGDFIGLAPHDNRVDRLQEFRRRGRYLLTPPTPINRMVFASDEVVEAVGETERDLTHGLPRIHHCAPLHRRHPLLGDCAAQWKNSEKLATRRGNVYVELGQRILAMAVTRTRMDYLFQLVAPIRTSSTRFAGMKWRRLEKRASSL